MLAVTHLLLLRRSYLVQILAVAAQKSSELWLRTHISSRQWGQLCIWGRKWLLKCRFRDYGAIQVSAGYGETKQLPTPTSRCLRATTHMHQQRGGCSLCGAWSFFFFLLPPLKRTHCWTANLRSFSSVAMIITFAGRRGRLQTGGETTLHRVWPAVLTYNKASVFIV